MVRKTSMKNVNNKTLERIKHGSARWSIKLSRAFKITIIKKSFESNNGNVIKILQLNLEKLKYD
jgi:hypothetical protein